MSSKELIDIGKIYQHGKTQLPREVRSILGLKDGDKICYLRDGEGRIYIEKIYAETKKKEGKYT